MQQTQQSWRIVAGWAAAAVVYGGSAAGLVIDDFSVGAATLVKTSANDSSNPATLVQEGLDPAAVLGGKRSLTLGQFGAATQSAVIDTDGGTLTLGKPAGTDGLLYLDVGYGTNDEPLDIDLLANGHDRFVLDADTAGILGIAIRSRGVGGPFSSNYAITASAGNGTQELLFSDFSDRVDLTDVQTLTIDIFRSNGVTLRSLRTAGPRLPGDYDHSGEVTQGDLDLVLNNWGTSVDPTAWPEGWLADLPRGVVDQDELDRVLNGWGGSAPPDFRGIALPEPGLAGVALLLMPWCARRAGRRVRR